MSAGKADILSGIDGDSGQELFIHQKLTHNRFCAVLLRYQAG